MVSYALWEIPNPPSPDDQLQLPLWIVLIFWSQLSLLAQFVCCNPIEVSMSFNGNRLFPICKYRMIAALSQQIKSVFFKISD